MPRPTLKPQGISKTKPIKKTCPLFNPRAVSPTPSTSSQSSDDLSNPGMDTTKYPLELILPELGLHFHPSQPRTHPFLTNPATAALFHIPSTSPPPPRLVSLVRARLFETLQLCHNWRDMLWRQPLPSPLYWQQVAIHARWSRRLNWSHLRDLILSIISQITLVHALRRPLAPGEEDIRHMTKLSVAALRVARDMEIYEADKKQNGTTGYLMSSHVRFEGEWALDGFMRMAGQRARWVYKDKTKEVMEWLGLLFVSGNEEGLWWWIKKLGAPAGGKDRDEMVSDASGSEREMD
jgi:hypothetical protein